MKNSINAKGKIFKTLQHIVDQMPKAMQKIANYILENPTEAVNLNISELSKNADVGEATVIRFIKNLGFPGFQEFKMNLAIEVNNLFNLEDFIIESQISDKDPPNIVGKKILNTLSAALCENIEFLNNDDINNLAAEIIRAKKVLIVGMGTSGLSAQYLKNKLSRIGFNAMFEVSTHYMYTSASLLEKGDILISISYKSSSYESVKALEIAKEAGATTALLTHFINSPVTDLCDYVFYTGNNEGAMQSDSLATIATQLHILEILYTKVVQLEPAKAEKVKRMTLNALEKLK